MKILVTYLCFFLLGLSAFSQTKDEQLFLAISKNETSNVEELVNDEADVNYIKEQGPWMKISCLIMAVNKNNIQVAKLLLENGADVNWKDGFQTSAIPS